MKKISAIILALSTLHLIGCSTATEAQPLEQFLGVIVDERFDGAVAWVARYDNLDHAELGLDRGEPPR